MSTSLFDPYEIRARLIPAAFVASPLLLPIVAFRLVALSTLTSTAIATGVLLILLYALSLFLAFLGRRAEPALWQSWGGPPSLTVLTEADKTFPAITKQTIRDEVRRLYNIDLTSVAAEPNVWRERATEAFRLVRQYLRQQSPTGIWSVHNAEYGAIRNILASAWVCFAFALAAAVACAVGWWMDGKPLPGAPAIVGLTIAAVVVVVRCTILPRLARSIAFGYAESAWSCFLNAAKLSQPQPQESPK
ncbi:MAG TPA: hypothetical protein VMU04_17185 [Candidatus Acidoferrum sp.]|nr:hypothetical protein [Candidatus Acidoferrum sp.]